MNFLLQICRLTENKATTLHLSTFERGHSRIKIQKRNWRFYRNSDRIPREQPKSRICQNIPRDNRKRFNSEFRKQKTFSHREIIYCFQ